jgi:hypothetical protein
LFFTHTHPSIACSISLLNHFKADVHFPSYNLQEPLANVSYHPFPRASGDVIQRRKEVESKTLAARKDYNMTAREQGYGL